MGRGIFRKNKMETFGPEQKNMKKIERDFPKKVVGDNKNYDRIGCLPF
jgi:hypothetical protein